MTAHLSDTQDPTNFYFINLVSLAILCGYGGLVVVYKIFSAFSSKTPEAEKTKPAAAKSEAVTEGFPSVESPEFDKFLESEAFAKLLNDDEQLNKALGG